jgi:hypothetical protein
MRLALRDKDEQLGREYTPTSASAVLPRQRMCFESKTYRIFSRHAAPLLDSSTLAWRYP